MVVVVSRVIATTIKEAYLRAVEIVLRNGYHVADERGDNTKEVLNLHSTIQFPDSVNPFMDIPRKCVWNDERLQDYADEFINPDNKGFIYSYGERLMADNQISTIIDRLNNCHETRRAVTTTWQPKKDTVEEDVPCLIMVDFKVRDNLIYPTAVWRSHDIYGAYFPNLIGLYYLSKYVEDNLDFNVRLGTMNVYSLSAHINENNFTEAEELIKRNLILQGI